jgi:hypothetical protein
MFRQDGGTRDELKAKYANKETRDLLIEHAESKEPRRSSVQAELPVKNVTKVENHSDLVRRPTVFQCQERFPIKTMMFS